MEIGKARARGNSGENGCLHSYQRSSQGVLLSQLASNPCFIYRTDGSRFKLSVVERKIGEIIQTLRLAKKTTKEDYNQHLRLVALGLAVVGGIAFVIKLIAEFITLSLTGQTSETG